MALREILDLNGRGSCPRGSISFAKVTFIFEDFNMANIQTYVDALADAKKDLSKIEARYEVLQKTINSLEQLIELSGGAPKQKIEEVKLPKLPAGTFEGLSIKPAAIRALYLVKKPLHAKHIGQVLENAGYKSDSSNLTNLLNTTLGRVRDNDGYVTRDDKYLWSLTETGRGFAATFDAEGFFELDT